MLWDFYKTYERNYVFEGEQREKYKRSLLKWSVLSCFSVLFPLFITFITDSYEGHFNIVSLINSGDLILSSFSLTVPTALDLFEMRLNWYKKNDNSINLCRYLCLFIIVIQAVFFVLIRTHKTAFISNLVSTVVIVPMSIYICRYSVFCVFINSIGKVKKHE